MDFFYRSGKYCLLPGTCVLSIELAFFRDFALNAWLESARERKSRMGQKISFLVRVKKKMVLEPISIHYTG